jgi:hypothetical protein
MSSQDKCGFGVTGTIGIDADKNDITMATMHACFWVNLNPKQYALHLSRLKKTSP